MLFKWLWSKMSNSTMNFHYFLGCFCSNTTQCTIDCLGSCSADSENLAYIAMLQDLFKVSNSVGLNPSIMIFDPL